MIVEFYKVKDGSGKNMLGKILMEIRRKLRNISANEEKENINQEDDSKSTKSCNHEEYRLEVKVGETIKESYLKKIDFESNTKIEFKIDNLYFDSIGEDTFEAMVFLREKLENEKIQLLCNGSAENVYPSGMQRSFGGNKAYKLVMGEKASLKNVVDIFEYDDSLNMTTTKNQKKYFDKWLESLKT